MRVMLGMLALTAPAEARFHDSGRPCAARLAFWAAEAGDAASKLRTVAYDRAGPTSLRLGRVYAVSCPTHEALH